MEHQVEITVSEHGRDPENGDRLLGAFHDLEPKAAAVIDQNTEAGTLSAVFLVDAEDAEDAIKDGLRLFVVAATNAQLEPTKVLGIRADASVEETPEQELQPAY